MICMECGAQMMKSSDPIKESFRGEEITVTGIEHYKCSSCGEILLGAEEGKLFDEKLVNQYSSLVGLLNPTEIKSIRTKYHLTQQEFEKVLGVSSPSVCRWETGKVIQSKPVDLLMRAYDDSPEIMRSRMEQVEVGLYATRQNIIPFRTKRELEQNTYLFSSAGVRRSYEGTFEFRVDNAAKEG